MNAPRNVISLDAAAALLQLSPDQLNKLVGAGVVRRDGPGRFVPAHVIRDYIGYLQKGADPDRRERAPTQAEVAQHLDMSDRNLREVLDQLGLDHKLASLSEIRGAYIRRLREQAAGRMGSDSGLDLVQERAALAREQREGYAIKNAVARGEYAPIGLLADVLAQASAAVVDRFDSLPGVLRKACPDLPATARDAVSTVLTSARNEWIRATAELVVVELDKLVELEDEDPAPPGGTEPAGQSDDDDR